MNYSGTDFYCDVALKGKVSLKIEYESDSVLAYHHTKPGWPVHIVVVPKKHIADFISAVESEKDILTELVDVLTKLSKKVKEKHGAARILTNLGDYQDSKHLHFHVSSGEPLTPGN